MVQDGSQKSAKSNISSPNLIKIESENNEGNHRIMTHIQQISEKNDGV